MKTLIVIGIMLVALIGVATAQEPVFSGPVGFNIVMTEEQQVIMNVRKLMNFTTRFGGTITVDPNSGDPSTHFPNVRMEGTVSDGTSISISCSWENMGGASAEANNPQKTVNDNWFLTACCSFTASNGSETRGGIAFLNLSGTMRRPKGWVHDYPESLKITGSKINGGTSGFVFKGTFSSTLTPQ
jgi:hypothetical protein